MKNKTLFIIVITFTLIIITNLVIVGLTCPSEIVLGTFENGNNSFVSKTSILIYSSLLIVFGLGIMIPSYIKEKKINVNLFMAYLILEIVLNILPYFGV